MIKSQIEEKVNSKIFNNKLKSDFQKRFKIGSDYKLLNELQLNLFLSNIFMLFKKNSFN